MKRLAGEFTDQQGLDELSTWRTIADMNEEVFRTSLTNEPFKRSGFIEFDETTPHGITFETYLTTNGWTEENLPRYNVDGSDRPEFVSQATKDAQKAEQDNINETENRPNLISALDEIPYQELVKAARDVLPYDQLVDYHSNMVLKQNRIAEILKEKGLDNTIENWDTEGAKTKVDLENEIKILRDSKVDS